MAARMEADVARDRAEAREKLRERGGAHVEYRVAVAAEPLDLAPELGAALGIEHHAHARMAAAKACELRRAGPARKTGPAEVPQHEARRMRRVALAMAHDGLLAAFEGEQRLEEAVAVDAFEEIVELARRARVDLDDADAPRARIDAQLHVEHAVAEAEALDEPRGERVDSREIRRGERGRILEALELVRAGIHDRIDGAEHRHAARAHVAVRGHLAPLGDLLRDHEEGILRVRRVRAHDVAEGAEQPLDDELLEPAEARV